MLGIPPTEIVADIAQLRLLLLEQHPDLASYFIEEFEAGWDNATFRLGARLLVRMPKRPLAAELIEKEQRWLPLLPALPLPIPFPIRVGFPGSGYPWRWSIVPWIEGGTADVAPLEPSQAMMLAHFLKALHQAAPTDAPVNLYRGCHLVDRQKVVESRLNRLSATTTTTTTVSDSVLAAWRAGLDAPLPQKRLWIHGDLHALNILVREGRLVSIIDWGDLCVGDTATDLISIWSVFDDPESRRGALACYGASPEVVARARAWVVAFGTLLLDSGRVDNRHAKMGADMFRRLADDEF